MAITNYSELVTAIHDWLAGRSDLADFTPDFITLAEQIFNYGTDKVPPLRIRDMETVDDLTPSSGICTLPSDYLQYRRVVEKSSPRRRLDYLEPSSADTLYPSRMSGPANHFTIVGNSLYTFPLASNDIELTYYAKIPGLSEANPTNWLLTKAPGVYLRAALVHAADFIKDEAEMTRQAALLVTLVNGMNSADQMANYARAGLTLRGYAP